MDTLHWDRRPVASVIPRSGRSAWSTLRLYEAGTDLRNDRLSRPKVEPAELRDVVAKTFDVVFSAAGRTALDAALDVDHGYPLAPLVVSLVDVWHEPLKPLVTAQAEALFDATVTQRQPFAEAAANARARVREAMEPLEADLQPGLARVARRLQRLQGEAARLPQSFRRAAEAALPQRLQAFRATWHRLLSFSSPAAARAAAALQRKAEAALDALPDPIGRHERLAAYERALQTLARGVNDPARYQVLLRLEQRHFDSRDFARFTRHHVESRLAAPRAPGNGRPPPGEALAQWKRAASGCRRIALRCTACCRKRGATGTPATASASWTTWPSTCGSWSAPSPKATSRKPTRRTCCATAFAPTRRSPPRWSRRRWRAATSSTAPSETSPAARPGAPCASRSSTGSPGPKPACAWRRPPPPCRWPTCCAPSATSSPSTRTPRRTATCRRCSGCGRKPTAGRSAGARISALALAGIEDDSRRLKAPAHGALRALRRLVQRSQDTALELARLRRDLARLDEPDAALGDAYAATRAQFLALQAQIRHDWAQARRRVHIRGAQRSR